MGTIVIDGADYTLTESGWTTTGGDPQTLQDLNFGFSTAVYPGHGGSPPGSSAVMAAARAFGVQPRFPKYEQRPDSVRY